MVRGRVNLVPAPPALSLPTSVEQRQSIWSLSAGVPAECAVQPSKNRTELPNEIRSATPDDSPGSRDRDRALSPRRAILSISCRCWDWLRAGLIQPDDLRRRRRQRGATWAYAKARSSIPGRQTKRTNRHCRSPSRYRAPRSNLHSPSSTFCRLCCPNDGSVREGLCATALREFR